MNWHVWGRRHDSLPRNRLEHCQVTEVLLLLTTTFTAGAPKSKEGRAVLFLWSFLLPYEFTRPLERVSIDENLPADLSITYPFDFLHLQKAFLDGSGLTTKSPSWSDGLNLVVLTSLVSVQFCVSGA